jgi:hypothetical protein
MQEDQATMPRTNRIKLTKRKAQKTATSGEKPHPWPYPDIPRPPILAGVDLISVPEAVGILGAKLYPDDWKGHEPPWRWRQTWRPLWLDQPLTREGIELPGETARARGVLFELDPWASPGGKQTGIPLFWLLHTMLASGMIRALVAWETAGDVGEPSFVRRCAEPSPPHWTALNALAPWGCLKPDGTVVEQISEMCWNSTTSSAGFLAHRRAMLGHPRGGSDPVPPWVYLPRSDIDQIGEKEIEEVEKENWIAVARLLLSNHPRADNKDVIAHLETEGYTVVLPTDDDVTGRIVIISPKGVTADPLVASFYSMLSRARRPD